MTSSVAYSHGMNLVKLVLRSILNAILVNVYSCLELSFSIFFLYTAAVAGIKRDGETNPRPIQPTESDSGIAVSN